MPGAEHDHSFDVFGTRVRVLLVSDSSSAARLDAASAGPAAVGP